MRISLRLVINKAQTENMGTHKTVTSLTCDLCELDPVKRYYQQHKFKRIASTESALRLHAIEDGWTFTPRRFLFWTWERVLCPACSRNF